LIVSSRRSFTVPLTGGRRLVLGPRTLVMGVLNITPDSFSDGGRHLDPGRAVEAALAMAEAGADIIDIGGESTRPGSTPVGADEEQRRVVPVIRQICRQHDVIVSVDTTKAAVAAAAVDAGAAIINDISGLRYDPAVAGVAAGTGAGLVLMHMRGQPAAMYAHAAYASVIDEVADELRWSMDRAGEAGVAADAIVLDPGIGFAKRAEHSWQLLARLDAPALRGLGRPFLVGPSRKSFLNAAIGDVPADGRDPATAAALTAAILGGAHIVRVHDVAGMVQAARVADMIVGTLASAAP
jgi:dihydropteroate synthase